MRAFGTAAVAAISGVVLWQLFATILLPVLGMIVGLIVTTAKVALLAAVIFFVYSQFKKRREATAG